METLKPPEGGQSRRVRLVRKLVTEGSLAAGEREEIGRESLCAASVFGVIREVTRTGQYFPPGVEPGKTRFEGYIFERLPEGGARIWRQKFDSCDPVKLFLREESRFGALEPALEAFVRLQWGDAVGGVPIDWCRRREGGSARP